MDDSEFSGLVKFVKQQFAEHEKEFQEDPVKAAAYHYDILPESGRGAFLRDWIDRSHTDQPAFDDVWFIAQTLLRRRERLPDELAEWLADVMAGELRRPSTGVRKYRERDRVITLAVHHLGIRFGLNLKQSKSGERGAYDVVGEAFGLSPKMVDKIWGQRDRVLSYQKPKKSSVY